MRRHNVRGVKSFIGKIERKNIFADCATIHREPDTLTR
jgi:hypothetical protein